MGSDAEKTMLDPSGGPASARMKLGAYEATEILGRGGMAVVYKGMQQSLGRVVAIKVLPKEFSRDRQFVGRFHREAESVAKLNHPNIIQIIDKGEDNGTCYFVMEYVKGQSLSQKLANKGCTFKELVQIALQVCAALHYAHETGVVHRDIKPGNILLDDTTGVAKVADFGIAQLAEKSTAIGTLTGDHMAMGTLDYMAPEQKRDAKHVDRRADIYSIGVMLYEMATGRVPMGIFDPPSKINRDLPRDFDVIVMKCLRDKPDERFQTCMDLANALAGLPQTSSTMVRMITSVKSGVTTIGTEIGRKNPRYIGAAVLLLGGIAAGVFGIVHYADANEKKKGTGVSDTKPADPVKPVDVTPPEDPKDADKAFAGKLDEAKKAIAETRFSDAEAILDGIAAQATGERAAAYAAVREQVRTERQAALNEGFRKRLAEAGKAAVNAADFGVGALSSLLEDAQARGADASVLQAIEQELKAARKLQDDASTARTDEERAKRFQEAARQIQKEIDEGDLEGAQAALEKARPDGKSPAEKAELDRLEEALLGKMTEQEDEVKRQAALLKAVTDAGTLISGDSFELAQKKVNEAKLRAISREEKDQVAALQKRLDTRKTEFAYRTLMEKARAREETDPQQAKELYLEAAGLDVSAADRTAAEKRAGEMQARIDADRAAILQQKYRDAMDAALKEKALEHWDKVKARAQEALDLKRDDPDAAALLREAVEKLKPVVVPDKPKPVVLRFRSKLPMECSYVTSVAVDSKGVVYVMEWNNDMKLLFRFDAQGVLLGKVKVDVPTPHRVAVDGLDRVWILDRGTHLLYEMDPAAGTTKRRTGAPGSADGQFSALADLDSLADGDLVVASTKNFRVQRVTADGAFKVRYGAMTDKKPPFENETLYPSGVAVDRAGNVYVVDSGLQTLMKFASDGKFLKTLRTGMPGEPGDMAWAAGRLYVVEQSGCRVNVFSEDGEPLGSYGKSGRGDGDFANPTGLAVTRDGKRVYVADFKWKRVLVLEEE